MLTNGFSVVNRCKDGNNMVVSELSNSVAVNGLVNKRVNTGLNDNSIGMDGCIRIAPVAIQLDCDRRYHW